MINYSIIKKCLSVRLFCLLLLMFSATIVFSQKRTISGNVVDEIKEPLIGVTVQVKGTTQGTVTDLDGNYSILVDNPNVTLIFSYVGYKKEIIPLKNRTVVNVTMQMDSYLLRVRSVALKQRIWLGHQQLLRQLHLQAKYLESQIDKQAVNQELL